jgi:Lon-like protease
VTTIEPMVPDGFGSNAASRPRRRHRWFLPTLIIFLAVVSVAYLVANHYTSKYDAIAPGSAQPVKPFISVPPDKIHQHNGKILLVTVSLLNVTPLGWIADKLNPDIQILKVEELTGPTPPSQLNQLNAVEMQTSTQTAVIVALRRFGYKVNLNGEGAEVDAVVSNSPAANVLVPGDVIVAFDGMAVTSSDTLVADTRQHKAGDRVTLTFQDSSRTVTKTIVLGQAPADSTTPTPHAFIGIQNSTKEQPSLPINVTIDPGNIGGPSAGLSFTLGIIDELSTSDITGGKTIAVTGTINPDGTVGDVGGVAQKAVAVRKAGAVAFLVPKGELKTAQQHAGPKVKVIEVTTLEQALDTMKSLGGDLSGLPPAPAQLSG